MGKMTRRGLSIIVFGLCGFLILRQFEFGGTLQGFQANKVYHHAEYPTISILDNTAASVNMTKSPWLQATTGCPVSNVAFFLFPSDPNASAWMDDALREIMTATKEATIIIDDNHLLFGNCSATSQVKIIPRCKHWILQTLDKDGQPKKVGGDEFYITYTDSANPEHPTAAAEVTDHQNGTYSLQFWEAPLYHKKHRLHGHGRLTVVFQYMCGIGRLAPPAKDTWKTGGATVATYSVQTSTPPPITPFPSSWSLSSSIKETERVVYMDDFGSSLLDIVAVGDSVMKQFVKPLHLRIPNIGRPLNTTTLSEWKELIRERLPTTTALEENSNNNAVGASKKSTILLLSSHAWDLLETDNIGGFPDHEQALRDLLSFVRTDYPQVKVFWKSPTALHVHVPFLDEQQQSSNNNNNNKRKQQMLINRLRYMSASRSYELYQRQRRIVTTEFQDVSFLDVYRASYVAADATFRGDGRHYQPDWNIMTVNWFLRASPVDQVWKVYYSTRTTTILGLSERPPLVVDCKTSVVEIVNGVLLATVSNRPIAWKDDDGTSEHCTLPLSSRRLTKAAAAATNTPQHQSPVLLLRQKERFLSLEQLRTLGNLTSGPDLRFTNILYSEGEDYLFGMILYHILGVSPSVEANNSPESIHEDPRLVSSESFVLATDVTAVEPGPCIDEALQNRTNGYPSLPCHILILSLEESLPTSFRGDLYSKWNCTPVPVLLSNKEKSNGFHSSISYLVMVAKLDVDAFVTVCDTGMTWKKSLLRYLQVEAARSKGILPIEPIPTYCCP
jgi:hypothetical protein